MALKFGRLGVRNAARLNLCHGQSNKVALGLQGLVCGKDAVMLKITHRAQSRLNAFELKVRIRHYQSRYE